MRNLNFHNPEFLFLLVLLIPIIVWYILRHNKDNAFIQVSTIQGLKNINYSFKSIFRHVLFGFRVLALALLIIAFARPQSTDRWKDISTEGIDIVLALDISSSMLAKDFNPNRLDASKAIATEFISDRPNDRIGLVVFSGESFTQCPLTTDHRVLINLFRDIESGMVEDGTAIGMGLATSVNRLKDSKAKSKVVILLTDGVNNRGSVAPNTAAEIAETFGIRVYTIGVGSMGTAPYPVQTPYGIQYQDMEVEIDEEVLQNIAHTTNGKYFRAVNNQKLRKIYEEIDKLEKSKIEVTEFSEKNEEFFWFVIVAIGLIIIEITLKNKKLIPMVKAGSKLKYNYNLF